MFAYLWSALISGILFFVYLVADSWWWIFGIITFVLLSLLDTFEVDSMYEDDERDVL